MKSFKGLAIIFLLGISAFGCNGQNFDKKKTVQPEAPVQTPANDLISADKNKNKNTASENKQPNSAASDSSKIATQSENLKEWIGKYPVNANDKKFASFFQQPKVKKILLDVLGKQGFDNLLKHFHGDDLIQEKAGFIVMLGTTARNSKNDVDYALVAINPQNYETHVYFVDDGHLTAFGNTSGEAEVPLEVEEMISIYATK